MDLLDRHLVGSLDRLPLLTLSWVGEPGSDPDGWAERADRLVVETARCPFRTSADGPLDPVNHGGVLRVLDRLDLTGRQVGAFLCCPSSAGSPEGRVADHQRRSRAGPGQFDLGTYAGERVLVVDDQVFLARGGQPTPLAPSLEAFVLAVATAHDAALRLTGEQVWVVADACAAQEIFRGVDIGQVFRTELQAQHGQVSCWLDEF